LRGFKGAGKGLKKYLGTLFEFGSFLQNDFDTLFGGGGRRVPKSILTAPPTL
jgi:hypothetical protein